MCVSVVCADDEVLPLLLPLPLPLLLLLLLLSMMMIGERDGWWGGEGADLNCLVFSAEMSATFKFNVASLLLLLCSAVVDASYALLVCSFFRLFAVLQQSLFYLEV